MCIDWAPVKSSSVTATNLKKGHLGRCPINQNKQKGLLNKMNKKYLYDFLFLAMAPVFSQKMMYISMSDEPVGYKKVFQYPCPYIENTEQYIWWLSLL